MGERQANYGDLSLMAHRHHMVKYRTRSKVCSGLKKKKFKPLYEAVPVFKKRN